MTQDISSPQTANDTQTPLTFNSLSLNTPILKALARLDYTTPTPIQAQAIPHALAGTDLLLSAQTGSGKTAAFVLPILDKLSRQKPLEKHIQALILTPTRELAQQVHDSIRRYGANLRGLYSIPLVGGAPYSGQIRALRKGVQIVIATPGRLIDHINDGRVDLSKLNALVLDEADRMLDMGFADDIKTILCQASDTRQTIMSSATWDGAVGAIAESYTKAPVRVAIKVESAHIEESVYFCDDFHHKNKLLLELLGKDDITQAVIFTATKRSTEELANTLTEAGFSARYLHGDLPQNKRNRIIKDIKSGKCNFLIATDVAARGIDISAISHVINYDLPRQVEDYVHRIGRCGRAGRTGTAMNLCSIDDRRQLYHINRYLKRDMKESIIEGLEPKHCYTPKPKRDNKRTHSHTRPQKRFGRDRHFDKHDTALSHDGLHIQKPNRSNARFDRPKLAHYDPQDKGNNSQGTYTKSRFDGRIADKHSTQKSKHHTQSKISHKKPKAVEEVFFAKRQDRKKRKFSEL